MIASIIYYSEKQKSELKNAKVILLLNKHKMIAVWT